MDLKGIVVKSTGSWFTVLTDEGTRTNCKIKGIFRQKGISSTNPVAVGDHVSFEIDTEGTGVINDIHERKNYIIRKATKLSKRSHIIASNVDCVYLVVTLIQPKTHLLFIDRFLVTTEAYHIPTEIIINKIDLYNAKLKLEMNQFVDLYQRAGYNCHPISAINNIGVEELKSKLKGKTNLLTGNSGVGKSTLINVIDPSLYLKVGDISAHHQRGIHTTTFAEMHQLSSGGFFIDTPGLKSFGTFDMEKEDLGHRFPEMRAKIGKCKFDNCQHINEPKCAVIQAVEKGEIAESRYNNYLNIYESDEVEGFK